MSENFQVSVDLPFSEELSAELSLLEPHLVTVVAYCRDEAKRLPSFLSYHKSIGVKQFVIVDNGSQDSSIRILEEDDQTIVISCSDPYSSFKASLRGRIADAIGDGAWILFLDIDEFFVFPHQSAYQINEYANRIESAGYSASLAVMVDVFSPKGPSELSLSFPSDISLENLYIDTAPYTRVDFPESRLRNWQTPRFGIYGGARARVLFSELRKPDRSRWILLLHNFLLVPHRGWDTRWKWIPKKTRTWLTKLAYPDGIPKDLNLLKIALVKWSRQYVFRGGTHRINCAVPYSPEAGVLLHVNLLTNSRSRIEALSRAGEHSHGASVYKKQISLVKKGHPVFSVGKNSSTMTSISSLQRLSFLSQSF